MTVDTDPEPTAPPIGDAPSSHRRVYIRGADGVLGGRVVAALTDRVDLDVVIGAPGEPAPAIDVWSDRTGSPVGTTIVELGIGDHDLLAAQRGSATAGSADLLADAHALGADHLVVVSSAMVYGALANNPVPITEEGVLRPDPDFVYARQLAAAEELVEAWRAALPDRRVAVLRPVIPIAADGTSSLARAVTAGLGKRFGEADSGAQFVHLDDVAAAVVLTVDRWLDGVYNVAPDGSIPGERVRALSGQRWRLPVPDRVGEVLAALQWRFQRGPIPPGLRSYIREPWIVANDKLRSEGWKPLVTNEQAYVEGTESSWWSMITPKRRQELALGGLIAGVAAVAGVAGIIGRRWWRRRADR